MQVHDDLLDNPDYFQNRELSWLDFNARVIEEADDKTNPLFEQLKFLAIGSSNLDEFYKVRVAGLQDQQVMGVDEADTKKQWLPKKQLQEITKKNQKQVKRQYTLFETKKKELKEHAIAFTKVTNLSDCDKAHAKRLFTSDIAPAITPYGIDAYRPFPHVSDGVLHLFVRLRKTDSTYSAIVPIPKRLKRIFSIKKADKRLLLFSEDIVQSFLSDLFHGYQLIHSFAFRVTRNADIEIQEEGAEDLLSRIEDYLEKRKNGRAVRLEIEEHQMNKSIEQDIAYLKKELTVKQRDIYFLKGPLDLTFLHDVVDTLDSADLNLSFKSFTPFYPNLYHRKSIYDLVKHQDMFFYHPFDSFQPIIQFIEQAVSDEQTIAIKQTLYRVSHHSPLVQALERAAKKGIQVTVLVELKARFDEANNVHWAKKLEEAGAHILYGVKGLKTHTKATLVIKKEPSGFARYAHLGTGNYNEKTATLYTDMGIVTANKKITQDVFDFFNYLSGYNEQPAYHYLHVSPFDIRDAFIENIEKEISLHKQFQNGHIIAKMNSLTDKKMLVKLYEASQAGVKIELIVRGICCLIPGIPGISENITVRSVIGRFLEHNRVYYFYHNGSENLYLSSADMMTRNMIKRVEIAFPVLDTSLKNHIISILTLYLYDNVKAWTLNNKGLYTKLKPGGDKPVHAQKELMQL
ncbi:MAG: polyphosphate kinase 1 [Alkalibacterium sp.]|uniref:Polyphosphate kinase n=1 Tax=Alkalibacterium gilvum TaxID=1130080 RepID=A0A1H6UIS5_9LACT|nr:MULTISPECIES: polyphosphate kinase 1 [Alkalibacterium]MDN6193705.1 polyphosphate kinase 1 [Alkalibacterium sp.]MDN6293668.1 polyphosphate kinase 1 [Alkalibacterium sp.]MDN6295580.1 polyphosphate kinase 1 [Alkalibacterium sp.]MDN6326841.1 polyphosphate kinase 1 [Alkalibacterium sp.]MDN6397730.1 polyphosphate kinase 1 [Alkalibacterium sp.]